MEKLLNLKNTLIDEFNSLDRRLTFNRLKFT